MPTKILAIDDSKTMRLAIKITFAAEDAEVVAVSKGSEAVARAKQMGADVVLVDHTLAAGEPSGQDVCAALKADPATANIPIIALLAAKGGPDPSTAASWGAEFSIQKPFDTQELIERVASVAGKPAAARPTAKPAAAKPIPAPPPGRAVAKPAPPGPAAGKPAVAKPPSGLPNLGAPKPAAKPAVTPAARPAGKPPSGPTASPKPVGKPPSGPTSSPRPVGKPPSGPTATPAAAAPAAAPAAAGDIPIAIPIPFTAANAPTSGMLERIKAAQASGGAAAGLDPQAIKALLALTHEVVEQVVWEVVPELAEELIKQKSG